MIEASKTRTKIRFSFFCAGVALWGGVTSAQDVSMFRGGPTHGGVYSGSVPSSVQVKWQFKTDGRIYSSAAIVNGVVYFGSFDGNLYAVDENTGALKWKFETKGPVTSSPAIAAGAVFFGSYDGDFYAVDAATGAEKWRFATKGERRYAAKHIHGIDPPGETMPDFWDFYLSSPVVADEAVYFGSGEGTVYKLDIRSGRPLWGFSTGDVVHSSPAIFEGTVYVGSFDKYFYAIDATTGRLKWRYKTGEDPEIHNQEGITSSPAIADGIVYFGCRNATTYALDALTGALKWAQKGNRGWVTVSPSVRDDKVFVATGSDRVFKILNAKTGDVLYSKVIGAATFSSPALAGDTVLLATFDAKLRAIDTRSGSEVVLYPLASQAGNQVPPKPIALDSNFYDDHVAGMIARLKQGAFLSSPVVANDTIFIGTSDGYMLALSK